MTFIVAIAKCFRVVCFVSVFEDTVVWTPTWLLLWPPVVGEPGDCPVPRQSTAAMVPLKPSCKLSCKITYLLNIPPGQSSAKLPVTRSLGHSVTGSLGHSVTRSFGHLVTRLLGHHPIIYLSFFQHMRLTDWLTNTQHQDLQVCFADNNIRFYNWHTQQ